MAKEEKVSPYTVLNRWLYDGSKLTKMPDELKDDKAIPQTILLYHFQSSPHILYLSELFNNWELYALNKTDVFKFLKQCVLSSGYKPPFIERHKIEKTKIGKVLKGKFPYLKLFEINLLVEMIDKSDIKDDVYETLGFYQPKKKKITKAEKQKMEEIAKEQKKTLTNLMDNFKNA